MLTRKWSGNIVRVLQWNVLSDSKCSADAFPYVDQEALEPNARHALHISELASCDPDLVILIDVDAREHFERYFQEQGYSFHYAPQDGNSASTGILLAWRSPKFERVETFQADLGNNVSAPVIILEHDYTKRKLWLIGTVMHNTDNAENLYTWLLEEGKKDPSSEGDFLVLAGDFGNGFERVRKFVKDAFEENSVANSYTLYSTIVDDKVQKVQGQVSDHVCYWHRDEFSSPVARRSYIVDDIKAPGLPSKYYPSNHLALCCDFEF